MRSLIPGFIGIRATQLTKGSVISAVLNVEAKLIPASLKTLTSMALSDLSGATSKVIGRRSNLMTVQVKREQSYVHSCKLL